MRTEHSIKNISMSIISQIVIILLGFLSRKIFLDSLGSEYLGINGLLSNVISAMVLIEGGIGISIVYNLYKPLADDDKEQIIALVQLYKKAYRSLAIILLIISIGIYPYVYRIIGNNIESVEIFIVYTLFVSKSIISYLYSYKWALINADQRGYILAKNNLLFQVISMIGKIIILLLTQNYILYLVLEFILFFIQNCVNSRIVNIRYQYIRTKQKHNLNTDAKIDIKNKVKAMFIQNIGNYAIFSTDNILISAFINVSSVGLYSNYTMIMGQVSSLFGSIIGGIGNSIGNLIATEGKEKTFNIFNISYFISFWIYSFSAIVLFNLVEPFISWWLGSEYLLDKFTFIVLIINYYINGMKSPIVTFKIKSGIFTEDKYAPVIEGVINLIFSVIFIRYFGLAGVFLGTTASYLFLSFWNHPRLVYKQVFNKHYSEYFAKYIKFLFIALISGYITTITCSSLISGHTFLSLILRGCICLIIPNLIYIFIFYKTEEFMYLWNIIKPIFMKVKSKLALG